MRKLAAYVILGINQDCLKEVLTIQVGENESSKYWLSVLNGLKNRGVKDILIICADGLSGIKEAISAAFPKTEYVIYAVRKGLFFILNVFLVFPSVSHTLTSIIFFGKITFTKYA